MQKPTIQARVTFLPTSEGGRAEPPRNSSLYRPHVVLEDPSTRVASVAADGRTLTDDYLGVFFSGDGEALELGVENAVTLELVYHPRVDYTGLVPGATFTIREGHKVVGFGRVCEDDRAAI